MTDDKKRLPLHRKYRPDDLSRIIGNDLMIQSLRLKVEEGIVTTYLLYGSRGCGKTTLARIMAKMLGAKGRDIREYNISHTGGKDAAIRIADSARLAPLGGKSKVYIMDECQKASSHFFNTLLKPTEEPLKNVYYIFCTTEPEKIIPTIRSRCTEYQVKRLLKKDMLRLINFILKEEGVDDFPEKALKKIIQLSEGIPRDALKILDSVIDIENDDELIETIDRFMTEESKVVDLCDALVRKESWKKIMSILKNLDVEPESVRYSILGIMNSKLLRGENERAANVIELFLDSYMYQGKAGLTLSCYRAIGL